MVTPITFHDSEIQVPCAKEQTHMFVAEGSLFSSSEEVREMPSKLGVCVLCFLIFMALAWIPKAQAQASTAGNRTAASKNLLDPVLSYSTYLGDVGAPPGSSAVDNAGNVCAVAGNLLTKLRSDAAVVYSKSDSGWGLGAAAIDSQGNCYVAGGGKIAPTPGAFQANALSGPFVMKFDAAGGIVYATYLGLGSGNSDFNGLAVDSLGNAYLSGDTNSNDFPTAHAFQATFGGGNSDAFVVVLNASGTGLVYSTYLGGSGNDVGNGIAVDSFGNAYVTGDTSSPNFLTIAAFQPSLGGTRSAFVVKLDSAGNPIYSTFLGGTGVSFGTGISVDTSGNAYVAGTAGAGFPLVNPLQSANSSSSFIAKLNASGSALLSTYFGFNVSGAKIAVDSNQRIYIVGEASTISSVGSVSSLQRNFGGGDTDGYVTVLDTSGGTVVFSTLLGGSGNEEFLNVGVDSSGNIYVSGTTGGTNTAGNFPIVNAINGTFVPFLACAPHAICGVARPIQDIVLKIAPVSGTVLAFPSVVDFRGEPLAIGQSSEVAASILVANPNSSNTITISGVVVAGDYSQTNNCPQTLGPGASCTLSITFTPTSAGTRTGTITITDSAPGSPHTINLIGTTLVPQVDITPTQLSFASEVVSGSSSPQTVTLTNTGGAPLSIGSISVLGDFAETNNCGVSVAASTTCQIAVTFTPTVTGNRTGTLTVVYTAAGSPQTVSLSGIGTGTSPALGLGVTPGDSSSATVAAGQPASYAFSIGGAGMSGTASLSCTGAPMGAACSIPTSEPLSATVPASFGVNVTTTSRTIGALHPPAFTPWLWTVAVLGIVVWPGMSLPKRSVRRSLWLIPLTLLFFLASCGGSGTTSGGGGGGHQPNPNGTPAGTYTLTVKATSGSTTETSSLTLIVQ
jgi:Beta-propeller repeat/Abnormal spindle-like microcephaly-assoc'd, ASPM-SPD-2-Hydin